MQLYAPKVDFRHETIVILAYFLNRLKNNQKSTKKFFSTIFCTIFLMLKNNILVFHKVAIEIQLPFPPPIYINPHQYLSNKDVDYRDFLVI